MRASVLVALVMAVAAGGLLWFGIGPATERHEDVAPAPRARTTVESAPVPGPLKSLPVAQAATVATAPVAPMNRMLSGEGLWDAYQSLRRSTNGGDLFVAERILRECFVNTRGRWSGVQRILAGEGIVVMDEMTLDEMKAISTGKAAPKTHIEVATADQVAAAREIVARCVAFTPMTLPEFRAQRDDVKGRRQHADDPVAVAEAIGERRLQATDERLRTVLESKDPVAFQLISGILSDRRRQGKVRPMSDDELTADAKGMDLLQCDLGNDCSAASSYALVGCTTSASQCRLDFEAQIMSRETPAVRQMIETQRMRMGQAIRNGDYAIWGL